MNNYLVRAHLHQQCVLLAKSVVTWHSYSDLTVT